MLFKYNFQEFSKKNFYKRPILKSLYIQLLIILAVLCYISSKDLTMFLFLFATIICESLTSLFHYNRYMSNYEEHLKKFEDELKLLENSTIQLGATLHDDYIEIAGVMSSLKLLGRSRGTHYFVYRKIYYSDIYSLDKNNYTTYIDFNTPPKFPETKYPPAERLFLNYYFENSDILYEMLNKKVEDCSKKSLVDFSKSFKFLKDFFTPPNK